MGDSVSRAFERLEKLLGAEGLVVSAAELHGMLTGLLASGKAPGRQDLYGVLADLVNEGEALSLRLQSEVDQLRQDITSDLGSSELNFQLLVPGDDEPLEERLAALVEWTQSFLAGFGINQTNLANASEDLREAIQDLAEIARLSTDASDGAADEQSYNEVAEYVRITAIMSFNELSRVEKAGEHSSQTLH